MYNLRYHIVSIVAVFLALALGLVLGGLIGDKATSTSQAGLVSSITDQFRATREESARVSDENKRLNAFGADALTSMTKGSLTGKTILVIGAQGNASKYTTQLLQKAGATVLTADIKADAYQASNKGLASVKLTSDLKTQFKADDDLTALAQGFAAEWSIPTTAAVDLQGAEGLAPHPVTDALQTDGIVKLSGGGADINQIDGVVDVALKGKDAPDAFGLTLAQAFKKQNVPAIVVQEDASTATLATAAVEQNLCATNLLMTPPGDWTVVAVLNGADQAPYGTLSGADQLYPPVR